MGGDEEHGSPQHPEHDTTSPSPQEEGDGTDRYDPILLGQANLLPCTKTFIEKLWDFAGPSSSWCCYKLNSSNELVDHSTNNRTVIRVGGWD